MRPPSINRQHHVEKNRTTPIEKYKRIYVFVIIIFLKQKKKIMYTSYRTSERKPFFFLIYYSEIILAFSIHGLHLTGSCSIMVTGFFLLIKLRFSIFVMSLIGLFACLLLISFPTGGHVLVKGVFHLIFQFSADDSPLSCLLNCTNGVFLLVFLGDQYDCLHQNHFLVYLLLLYR